MPENMTAKEVNACNGGIPIVPANIDGKTTLRCPTICSSLAQSDSVGFYYKEIARWR